MVRTSPPDRRPERFDVAALVQTLGQCRPRWVAFNGKHAATVVARSLGHRPPPLGPLSWSIGGASVFVLPSSSGANQRREYDGRGTRLSWWAELAGRARARSGGRHSATGIAEGEIDSQRTVIGQRHLQRLARRSGMHVSRQDVVELPAGQVGGERGLRGQSL